MTMIIIIIIIMKIMADVFCCNSVVAAALWVDDCWDEDQYLLMSELYKHKLSLWPPVPVRSDTNLLSCIQIQTLTQSGSRGARLRTPDKDSRSLSVISSALWTGVIYQHLHLQVGGLAWVLSVMHKVKLTWCHHAPSVTYTLRCFWSLSLWQHETQTGLFLSLMSEDVFSLLRGCKPGLFGQRFRIITTPGSFTGVVLKTSIHNPALIFCIMPKKD